MIHTGDGWAIRCIGKYIRCPIFVCSDRAFWFRTRKNALAWSVCKISNGQRYFKPTSWRFHDITQRCLPIPTTTIVNLSKHLFLHCHRQLVVTFWRSLWHRPVYDPSYFNELPRNCNTRNIELFCLFVRAKRSSLKITRMGICDVNVAIVSWCDSKRQVWF